MSAIYKIFFKVFLPLIVLALIMLVYIENRPAVEAAMAQDGPDRAVWITVDSTSYDWWLARWADNQVTCQLSVDHEGTPTLKEVQSTCGNEVYYEWLNTPPCTAVEYGKSLSSCDGLYLQPDTTQKAKKEILINLPPPQVWISVRGNLIQGTTNKWAGEPRLVLTGEEKLANENIIRINGEYAGTSFSCEGNTCELPLATTIDQGITLTFWGDSSYGDTTGLYTAYVRVLPWAEQTTEGAGTENLAGYYVDIISPQYQGQKSSSCAAIWQSFPPVTGSPDWLDTPDNASDLSTSLSLHFLAAMLIQNREVDASGCPGGGLDYPTAANKCGVDKAREALDKWQNQFDGEIMLTSSDTGIPAQLLKNIFAHESQLWPGIYHDIEEAGLGQLTENGAEQALLWNPDFYSQFCPLVLLDKTCALGYGNLTVDQQTTLRGALVQKVNATCPDCPMGIDLNQANFSVHIFGETLLGNCAQVNRMVYNLTNQTSGTVSSYTDLWRFTLVNYNGGPGCLWTAMSRTWKAGNSLDWVHVAANLDPVCRSSVDYVNTISEGDTAKIPVFSTLIPTPTLKPTATPRNVRPTTPANTPTVTGTITFTKTPSFTPAPSLTPTPTNTPTGEW